MLVVVLVVVLILIVAGVLVMVVRGAQGQGVESEMVLRTHDELSRRHVDDELAHLANTGIDVDGRLADTIVPEPDGPPPVAGSQWDERAGHWIHWDTETQTWIQVPSGPA